MSKLKNIRRRQCRRYYYRYPSDGYSMPWTVVRRWWNPSTRCRYNRPPALPWNPGVPYKAVDCGTGWYPIIRGLHTSLKAVCPDYVVVQVKEKFGALRYYIGPVPEGCYVRVSEIIGAAESLSMQTCEWCGIPGTFRNKAGWMKTLCDDCHEEWLRGRKVLFESLDADR